MKEKINRKAWILTPLYTPKEVLFVGRYSYGDIGEYVNANGRRYAERKVFNTKEEAIKKGFALVQERSEYLQKQFDLLAKRQENLQRAAVAAAAK